MNDRELKSAPLLSIFEISPVLIPYFLAFYLYLGFFTNFPLYIQITRNISSSATVNIWAIISGFALLIGALTRLPAGLISDKIGRVNGFYLAYFSYIVSMVLVLFIDTNIVYLLAMGLIRFGSNMVAMTGRAVVSTANRDRALKNGLLSSMTGLGSFIGPLALGYILDHYPPDTIFYATIGVILLDLLLFRGIYGYINHWFKQNEADSDLEYTGIREEANVDYYQALTTKGIPIMLFLYFTAGLTYGLVQSIYSIYGYSILFLSTTTIGLITGLASLTQTAAAPIAGRLYVFIKDEYLRIVSWVFFLLGGTAAALSPIWNGFFISSFFLINIGFASYFTMEITRMSIIVDKNQFSFTFGVGTSLSILATSTAGFISPLLFAMGPETNFIAAVIIAAVSLAIIIAKTPQWLRER